MSRLVAPLTVAFGVLTLLTALATLMVAVPLAMVTMITGFCWYMERPRAPRHTGLCRGCLRSLEEIAAWAGAADEARLAVLAAVEARRQAQESPAAAAGSGHQ